ARQQVTAYGGLVLNQSFVLQHFDGDGRSSRGQRIRAKRRRVVERIRMKGAPDLVSGMESRTRDDAAGHGLAETQNVGHHTAMVAVKHGASSSETRLNFIQDQQCAAFRAEPASSRQ